LPPGFWLSLQGLLVEKADFEIVLSDLASHVDVFFGFYQNDVTLIVFGGEYHALEF